MLPFCGPTSVSPLTRERGRRHWATAWCVLAFAVRTHSQGDRLMVFTYVAIVVAGMVAVFVVLAAARLWLRAGGR